MEDRTLILTQDDGTEIVCAILFTYSNEDTSKNYVVFKVRDTDEVSAAVYYPDDNNGQGHLGKIETDDEWEMLEDLLNEYVEEQRARSSNGCSSCGGGCSSCGGGCDCDGECDCTE